MQRRFEGTYGPGSLSGNDRGGYSVGLGGSGAGRLANWGATKHDPAVFHPPFQVLYNGKNQTSPKLLKAHNNPTQEAASPVRSYGAGGGGVPGTAIRKPTCERVRLASTAG